MILGFKDPRDVVKGRIDSRINSAESDAVNQARGAVLRTGDKAQQAARKVVGKGPAKKKKSMSWWPFGKKDEDAAPACGNCGKEVDPSWQACPYCAPPTALSRSRARSSATTVSTSTCSARA